MKTTSTSMMQSKKALTFIFKACIPKLVLVLTILMQPRQLEDLDLRSDGNLRGGIAQDVVEVWPAPDVNTPELREFADIHMFSLNQCGLVLAARERHRDLASMKITLMWKANVGGMTKECVQPTSEIAANTHVKQKSVLRPTPAQVQLDQTWCLARTGQQKKTWKNLVAPAALQQEMHLLLKP